LGSGNGFGGGSGRGSCGGGSGIRRRSAGRNGGGCAGLGEKRHSARRKKVSTSTAEDKAGKLTVSFFRALSVSKEREKSHPAQSFCSSFASTSSSAIVGKSDVKQWTASRGGVEGCPSTSSEAVYVEWKGSKKRKQRRKRRNGKEQVNIAGVLLRGTIWVTEERGETMD
jgi:hypothetical protein